MEFSNVEQRTQKFPSVEPALDRSFVFIHRTVSGHRKKRQGAVEPGRSPWKSSAVVGDIQLFSASKALALAHCTIAMMRKSLISRC